MDISKALRKQKKSIKRFWLSMGFIFFILPTTVLLNRTFSFFIILYLFIIEILIIVALIVRTHKDTLKFKYDNKLRIQNGLFRGKYYIDCEKVVFVHCIGEEDFKILIILRSRLRNKNIKVLDSKFFEKYAISKGLRMSATLNNLEKKYYYIIINRGGYKKYELINTIYRYCVKARFTGEAIEKIKEYRSK